MRKPKKLFYLILLAALSMTVFSAAQLTGITRGALTQLEQSYESQIAVTHIAVALSENDTVLEDNATVLKEIAKAEPGKTYSEKIAAVNTTDADEYVRIIVRKYWLDTTGAKAPDLSSDLIKLSYGTKNYNSDAWQLNAKESTEERQVYYLNQLLDGSGDGENVFSAELFDTFSIDASIASVYTDVTNGNVITRQYTYDGYTYQVEIEVQSIQTGHAADAITSVWGVRNVTVDGTALKVQ